MEKRRETKDPKKDLDLVLSLWKFRLAWQLALSRRALSLNEI